VVNTASRLQQVAPVGGVVVGEMTHRTTRHVIDYEELEPVVVKGKAEPVPVWRALEARSRFGVDWEGVRAPLIGREDDLALLKQTYARTLRESSVQLVTVVGEPGVGKTRLVREFFTHVDDQPGLTYWRQGRCLAYGENITFWALGEIVKAQAGIFESDGPEQAWQKLARAVEAVVDDPSEREWVAARLAPLVAAETGPSAGVAQREESFGAWRRFLEGVASIHPLVLVVEDLHWADPALLEFVEHLADWAADVPLLIVCTARPELYEAAPGWGGGKRNSVSISLSPLSSAETARLISALLEQAVLPAETQAALLDRAGGNPLYTEEFVRMLIDREILVRRDRGWEIAGDGEIPVPETVQSIIAARLDTLPAIRKALAHDASVVGKVFWSGALASMGAIDEAGVLEGLHELARKELVRRDRRSSVEGQVEYAFWHALIRDVAYGQIPRAERAGKHRAAARWIEGLAGDRVTDHAEFLAYHLGQALDLATASGSADAGEIDQLEEQTRRFLVMAGVRAMDLDPARAGSFYDQALRLYPEDDPERPVILVKATRARWTAGQIDHVAAEAEYTTAIELFRKLGDRVRAGEAMVRASTPVWARGDTAEAMELVTEAVAMLEPLGPGPELAEAYSALAGRKMLGGQAGEALPWAGKALDLAERLDLAEFASRARQIRGMARCTLGDVDGLADLREGLRIALAAGVAWETSNAYLNLSFFLWLSEGPAAALATHREAIELNTRRGLPGYAAWATAETCWFLFDLGRWDELIRVADEVGPAASQMELAAETHAVMVRSYRGGSAGLGEADDAFLDRARHIRDPQILLPALGIAVVIERERGDHAAVVRLVEELHETARERPAGARAWFLPEAVRACAAAGSLDLAERLFEDVEAVMARDRHSVLIGQAVLDEARGEIERAAGLYREAAERWAEYGHIPERGLALLGLGRCLTATGGSAEAVAALRDAREIFVGLGARPLLEETDAWLAKATALSS
jgi:tetratricopeptide (TPR) repeat protein